MHLFYPRLRMGRGGSSVDNVCAGGVFCSIDKQTGIVITQGASKGDALFLRHPDSGVILPGFQIPEWDKAVELVIELATVLPDIHYAGWDLAHTDHGWVLVEANACGQFFGQQKSMQKGHKRELMALMEKI